MSDPRGDRRVQLGGRRRVLRYDFNALADLELALGVEGPQEIFAKIHRGGMGTMRALVWAGLLHEDEPPTLREVGAWLTGISGARWKEIGQAAGEALRGAFPDVGGDDSDGDGEDPTRAAGSKRASKPRSARA